MTDQTSEPSNKTGLWSPVSIAMSFLVAFWIQLIVHECSHYVVGLLTGASDGHLYLHPFYNSKVVFIHSGSKISEILTGIAGPILDLVFSTLVGILFWHKKTVKWLPLLMWGSIAYIGEGIGMLSSIAIYPDYIEDMTQLVGVGVPIEVLTLISILLLCIGLVWMVLLMPMAGIPLKGQYLKRLIAYLCCLPLYFGLAFCFIKVFKPMDYETSSMRLMQLQISAVLAFLLTLLHQPINNLMKLMIKPKGINHPTRNEGLMLGFWALILLGFLLSYYGIFNT